jgi:hypothetical protein
MSVSQLASHTGFYLLIPLFALAYKFLTRFSVFLDAADVVLAKRRISDIATMLHLRYAVLRFYAHADIHQHFLPVAAM